MICPPDHKHNSTCYVWHKCRCDACRAGNSDRERERKKLKAYGRWDTGLVDAGPVRAHVVELQNFGVGYMRVARLAGVQPRKVASLLYGRQESGPRHLEPVRRIKREHADAILAVTPERANLAGGSVVSSLGTRRRIQALVACGWSQSKLAGLVGMDVSNFWRTLHHGTVLVSTARTVAGVYDRLWDQVPDRSEHYAKIAYSRSRGYAKRHGWLPPLAWDDIDDPSERPEPVKRHRMSSDERFDEVVFLLSAGESVESVARAVGASMVALETDMKRHGRADLAGRFGRSRRDESRRAA